MQLRDVHSRRARPSPFETLVRRKPDLGASGPRSDLAIHDAVGRPSASHLRRSTIAPALRSIRHLLRLVTFAAPATLMLVAMSKNGASGSLRAACIARRPAPTSRKDAARPSSMGGARRAYRSTRPRFGRCAGDGERLDSRRHYHEWRRRGAGGLGDPGEAAVYKLPPAEISRSLSP